jgi:hypothetical protein
MVGLRGRWSPHVPDPIGCVKRKWSFLAKFPKGEARARRFATVRVQTGACRDRGLQLGAAGIANCQKDGQGMLDRVALQKLEVVRGVHFLDALCHRWHGPLAPGHGAAGGGQHVAAITGFDPLASHQRGHRLDPRAAAQVGGRNHASTGAAGGGTQQQAWVGVSLGQVPAGCGRHRCLRRRLRLGTAGARLMAASMPAALLGRRRHPGIRHPRPTARLLTRRGVLPRGPCNAPCPPPAVGQGARPCVSRPGASHARGDGGPRSPPIRSPPAPAASGAGARGVWLVVRSTGAYPLGSPRGSALLLASSGAAFPLGQPLATTDQKKEARP